MTEYRNKVFNSFIDRGGALVFSDIACLDCEFVNCALSLTTDIDKRATIDNALFRNCTVSGSDVGPAVLKSVHVDGLITDSLLVFWGAVFDQVAFSGSVGKVKINRHVHHVDRSELRQKPFDEFRRHLYDKSEWAIDISCARFRLLEISGIPAKSIRRDPNTQMVVTRERALKQGWRPRLSTQNNHWRFAIDMFLATDEEDRVLVAPLVGPKKQNEKLLNDLKELRDLGVVE